MSFHHQNPNNMSFHSNKSNQGIGNWYMNLFNSVLVLGLDGIRQLEGSEGGAVENSFDRENRIAGRENFKGQNMNQIKSGIGLESQLVSVIQPQPPLQEAAEQPIPVEADMLPPENIHHSDDNNRTQLQTKFSLNNKAPQQKRNMPIIPEQDETFISGGAERLDGSQKEEQDQIQENRVETTPDINYKFKAEDVLNPSKNEIRESSPTGLKNDAQSIGITYNEDDENSI